MSMVLRRARRGLEWAALALLVALLIRGGITPGWEHLHTDFQNYYVAARLHRDGYPLARIYDWVWFQRQKDHLGLGAGIVSYTPITPFSALVMAPFASLPGLAAKRCWLVVDALLLGGTIALLGGMTRLPVRRIAIIALLAVVPLQSNFEFGQQYVLVLFLVTLSGWLSLRGKHAASAIGLAFASVLKLYPALLAVFFLVQGRRRAFCVFAVALAALVLLGGALLGPETLQTYFFTVLPRALRGEINDPYYLPSSSITVLLRRLFVPEPDLNPNPLARSPLAYALLQPVAQAALIISALWIASPLERVRAFGGKLVWGAFAVWPIVLSTATSTYHYCVLVLATVLAVDFLAGAGRRWGAAGVVGLHALVCAPLQHLAPVSPSGWAILLGAPRLVALLAYWGGYLWTVTLAGAPHRSSRQRGAFAAAFVGLTLLGVTSNVRHFDGLFADSAARLATRPDVFVASSPAAAPEGIYFSRMADDSYLLDRTGSWLTTAAPDGTDFFHPTVSRATGSGFTEVSSGASRVARFPLGRSEITAAALPVEVDDGEQPTVSADGRRLGFIREDRGRGSLWLKDLDEEAPAVPARQVLDSSHDVFDFAFLPADRIVFAGRRGTRIGLYVMSSSPASGVALTPLDPAMDGSARYPAVSPDERWLAYSAEQGGAWQLRVRDLVTGDEHALTHADCNGISPAWEADSKSIVYATDCGRGLGITALARATVP